MRLIISLLIASGLAFSQIPIGGGSGGSSGTALPSGPGLIQVDSTGIPSVATSSDVITSLGYTPQNTAQKGANNGYAGLDGSGKLAVGLFPFTLNGNSGVVRQWSGSATAGNCISTDASGNLVDTGSPCGSSGGTVASTLPPVTFSGATINVCANCAGTPAYAGVGSNTYTYTSPSSLVLTTVTGATNVLMYIDTSGNVRAQYDSTKVTGATPTGLTTDTTGTTVPLGGSPLAICAVNTTPTVNSCSDLRANRRDVPTGLGGIVVSQTTNGYSIDGSGITGSGGGYPYSPATQVFWSDDLLYQGGGGGVYWTAGQGVGGEFVIVNSTITNHPGVFMCHTQTTADNYAKCGPGVNAGNPVSFKFGANGFRATAIVNPVQSGTNAQHRFCLGDRNFTLAENNAICLEKMSADTTWKCVAYNGGTRSTPVDTTYATTANTWAVLQIREITATSFGCKVASTYSGIAGATEYTVSSGLPTAGNNGHPYLMTHNNNTVNDIQLYIDYFEMTYTVSR